MLGHRMALYGGRCQVNCGGEGAGWRFATNRPVWYSWEGKNAGGGKIAC